MICVFLLYLEHVLNLYVSTEIITYLYLETN